MSFLILTNVLRLSSIYSVIIQGFSLSSSGDFEKGVLATHFNLDYRSCTEECSARAACHSVKYTRKVLLCELFNIRFDVKKWWKPGVVVWNKCQNSEASPLQQACSECTDSQTCSKDHATEEITCQECPVPKVIPGADMFGNMLVPGSRVKYKCTGTTMTAISTCQRNGTWSEVDLPCKCKPRDISHATVKLIPVSHGIVTGEYTCDAGYKLVQPYTSTCTVATGIWSESNYACCHLLEKDSWVKVYSHSRGDIKDNWELSGRDRMKRYPVCNFRHAKIIDKWKHYGILRVRLNIVVNDTVESFAIFNGTNTDTLSWFSKTALIESSWEDLNATTTKLEIFTTEIKGSLRLFIMETVHQSDCYSERGWFMVVWKKYPCGTAESGIKILYARSKKASPFTQSVIGVADRFEIWIER